MPERPIRLGISFEPLAADIDQRLEVLDDAYAIVADDGERDAALSRALPATRAGDDLMLDPAGLVAYRRAGYGLICWTTAMGEPWCSRLARARALELRLYIVVFDRCARRAFAVDPDGKIVAGTFDDYRLASFTFDPRAVSATSVAPGSDVAEGLQRIEKILSDAIGEN